MASVQTNAHYTTTAVQNLFLSLDNSKLVILVGMWGKIFHKSLDVSLLSARMKTLVRRFQIPLRVRQGAGKLQYGLRRPTPITGTLRLSLSFAESASLVATERIYTREYP
jgi:hypothetical protein